MYHEQILAHPIKGHYVRYVLDSRMLEHYVLNLTYYLKQDLELLVSSLSLYKAIEKKDFVQVETIVSELTADRSQMYSPKRRMFTFNFAWAIPTINAVDAIVEFAGPDQILEICCGLGLWAGLIRARNGNIIPTDPFVSHWTSKGQKYVQPIHQLDGVSAVNKFKTNVLFICWPGYDESYAYDTLKAFKGNKLVYIGESKEGCNANDDFFVLLDNEWDEIHYSCNILRWCGINDNIRFFTRKEKPPCPPKSYLQALIDGIR
jgi:hypothetical protein